MKRRDFFEILSAGITVTVTPNAGTASEHNTKMSQLAIPENSIIFTLYDGVRERVPLEQVIVLEWAGVGIDGKLYEDYTEAAMADFDEFKDFGAEMYDLLVEQIVETPQIAHLQIPTWENIISEIAKEQYDD